MRGGPPPGGEETGYQQRGSSAETGRGMNARRVSERGARLPLPLAPTPPSRTMESMADDRRSRGSIVESLEVFIGERTFVTTLATLLKQDSLLAELATKVSSQSAPCVFFDRDPTHFRYVLNYLRDGSLLLPPDLTMAKELLAEVEFYQLRAMAVALKRKIRELELSLSPLGPLALARCSSGARGGLPCSDCPLHLNSFALPLPAHTPKAAQPRSTSARRTHITVEHDLSGTGVSVATTVRKDTRVPVLVANTPKSQVKHPTLDIEDLTKAGRNRKSLANFPSQKVRNTYFSWQDIRQHNTKDDCWLVVKGGVYDVTEFLHLHPAGENTILRKAGTDVTTDYGFHSSNAKAIWQKLRIGTVEGHSASACAVM